MLAVYAILGSEYNAFSASTDIEGKTLGRGQPVGIEGFQFLQDTETFRTLAADRHLGLHQSRFKLPFQA